MHAEFDAGERLTGGWRAIAAAWAVVLVVVLGFVGFSVVQHATAQRPAPVEHVVIPRHDPLCYGIDQTPRPTPEACAAESAAREIPIPAPM